MFLINLKDTPIEGVLVASKGYGKRKGEQVKTSVLRHSLGIMEGNSFKQVEPIDPSVLTLTNEYWVSFFEGTKMFDKKYVILRETDLLGIVVR